MFLLFGGSLPAVFHPEKLCGQVPRHQTQSQLPGLFRAVCLTQAGLAAPLFSGLKESQGKVALGLARGPDGGRKDVLKAHGLVGVLGGCGKQEPGCCGRAPGGQADGLYCSRLEELPIQSGPGLGGGNTSGDSVF